MTYPLIRHSFVGFCLKILNSTIVIGLYYGFLSTISIGPSYLFLIRARVMEKGSETEIAATTGFLTGRVMMFISIYYAPFHVALNRPHTLTFLTLPYLFFNYVYQNKKHYYLDGWGWESYADSVYKNPNPNPTRKFRTYKVFLNNLFFQLLNPVLFPSSILIRLMNIYLFRSNNKLFFLTSSFVGWLIGHILLMKCIGLVLVWFKNKNSIKSKITKKFDKYTLLQLRNYLGQLFIVFAFAIFARYSGRAVLPYLFSDEMTDYDERNMEEIGVAIDAEKQENDEEEISDYFSSDDAKTSNNTDIQTTTTNTNIQKKTKIDPPVDRGLVSILFDYQQWIRPFRYIQNDYLERVVRDENSQFFFQTCESDGKKRISFTYPPHLSTFQNILKKKLDLFRTDKNSNNDNDNELSNSWISRNKEKKNQLSTELFQRAKIIDKKVQKGKEFNLGDVLETRVRLSDDRSRRKYLPKIYDPFLNGPARGEIQKSVSPLLIKNETDTKSPMFINKIHGLLLCMNTNSPEWEQKIDKLDRKLVFTEMGFFFQLMTKFSEKSVSNFHFDELYLFPEHEQVKIYSEEKKRKRNFLFDAIRTNPFNQKTIFNRVLCSEIKEISKEVPRWNYELIDETELIMDPGLKDCQIRSPQADRLVLFNTTEAISSNPFGNADTQAENAINEFAIPAYSRGPDFQRDLIKGSWRPLRRKTVTSKLFQGNGNVHSPLFLEMINNNPSFFGDALEEMWQYSKEYFRKLMKPGTDNLEFLEFLKRANEREKDQKLREEEYDKDEVVNTLQRVEASWESILYGLVIRNFVLLFQSRFRKYILLPSLIITKNIIRILLFQNPEFSEDFQDWERETHINCTYQGTPVENNELPFQWATNGLQIRVLFPFVLKAWHDKPKVRSTEKKRDTERRFTEKRISQTHLWFLTAFGTVLESYPQEHVPNPFAFLGPILKQITKYFKKELKKRFRKFYNEREKKESRILLEEFKEIEIPKNAPISKSNPMIEESPLRIQSIKEKRIKAAEKRIKSLNEKTEQILKEIEKMKKDQVLTDPTRLELLKNSWKIFKRRNVRLIRKSYYFFEIYMERLYVDIMNMDINYVVGLTIDYVEHFLTSSIVQRYFNYIKLTIKFTRDLFELTKNMVKKYIYNKKNEQSIDKTNQSIIPFMSIIDNWNITDMNSVNSCDVSSLSQAYVLFKLSQMQVSNGYKYKLRSILESPGRSFFLKNEIKDYLLKLQGGRFNSKLRHKNRPDSIMNQWTNWLKIHYQYTLPQSAWSSLEPQKWRNTIHEHRVSQKKDLLEYDSSQKIQLMVSKKRKVDLLDQIDLLKNKKKIKKQYGYDLFAYQYINYVDKPKSYTYGYTSPCYNTPKNIKELVDIMGDSFIQNYISEDGILDENKPDRKYRHWRERRMGMNGKRRRRMGMNGKIIRMGMNGKRKNNSITNGKLLTPSFGFFSSIDTYKQNPWILPLNFLFMPFYGKNNITDQVELALEKKEYEIHNNLKLYLDKYYPVRRFAARRRADLNRFRTNLSAETSFLINKYFGGFYIYCPESVNFEENFTWRIGLISRMSKLQNPKQMLISCIKKGELDLETLVRVVSDDTFFFEGRDIEEVKENLVYSVEPIRFSRNKNYEQSFLYQTISVALKHKRQMLNSEKRRLDQKITENKDKNHYDLLVPENILSPRRRRELRILICLNHRNRKTMDRNTIKEKEKKNSSEVLTKKKDLESDTKKLKNLKFFLWPNYRFEDLACMNRYWFDTHNGSRFSILRIRMYPRLD
uniref:Protein TIC 214 n=1 Tax=Lathyrus odoratus TaxID=3859 RepID=A0A0F6NKP6_LATOD|nr:hypothetical chloroplast RF19 [Lathyrus odoratus]AIL55917.1 hypothetical chloroplast RF19 [Lathyrus odoratus]